MCIKKLYNCLYNIQYIEPEKTNIISSTKVMLNNNISCKSISILHVRALALENANAKAKDNLAF